MMFKVMAIVHSLKSQDEVTILHENGPNDVIAEYGGKRCTAIYNIFNGLYYVDDKYGILQDQDICPSCGEKLMRGVIDYGTKYFRATERAVRI